MLAVRHQPTKRAYFRAKTDTRGPVLRAQGGLRVSGSLLPPP